MALEFGLWRIDSETIKVDFTTIDEQERLQPILAGNIEMVDPNLLVIGREVATPWHKRIDILALNRDGQLVVLELKRGRTPREVIAQVLEYGSFIRGLRAEEIVRIYNAYLEKYYSAQSETSLDDAFKERFQIALPEELNEEHQLIVVATELDPTSERIVDYLADSNLNINVVFFRVFRDGDREYLARAWMRDPTGASGIEGGAQPMREWNGEYYVSFGEDDRRSWEEAVKYGFISGGGGPWYSRTLNMLEEGNRIWVNIPGRGYTGVGIVTETTQSSDEFKVSQENGDPILYRDISEKAAIRSMADEGSENAEYFVKVDWLKTVPNSKAISEKGFFGNQHTVARPRTEKWEHTVMRLKMKFGIDE